MGHSPVFAPFMNVGASRTSTSGDNYAKRYRGDQVTQTTSGAVTINAANGGTQKVIANGNVVSLTITAGVADQKLTLILKQDAGGTSTWPTTITNAALAGGAFVKSAIANAVDVLAFAWDSDASKWLQIAPIATVVQ